MARQEASPSGESGGVGLLKKLRLSWRLLRDPLVPVWTKLIPLGAVVYLLLPGDIIPDLLLGLGQADDLGILLLGLKLFIDFCPSEIVERHLAEMSSVKGAYRIAQDDAPQAEDGAGCRAESPCALPEGTTLPDIENEEKGSV